MRDFYKEIREWGVQKGIYAQRFSLIKIIGFINKELEEVELAENEHDRIGELSDIVVFAANALFLININFDINKLINDWVTHESALDDYDTINGALAGLAKGDDIQDGFVQIILLVQYFIEIAGYDFNVVMDETLKKINSREGFFDKDSGKWKKIITGNEYKPDYSVALF